MSRNGHIDLDFCGETRRFRLSIGNLEELQEVTGIGPYRLLSDLMFSENYRFSDIASILRCGLIGGGTAVGEASNLARGAIDLPLAQLIITAGHVIAAALEQPEGEEVRNRSTKEASDEDLNPSGRLHFAGYMEGAAMMGLPVSEVRSMSLWQFMNYVNGFRKANDPKAAGEISAEEEERLWALVKPDAQSEEAK